MSFISCFLVATLALGSQAQEFAGYARTSGNCPGSVLLEELVQSGPECAKKCSENEQCKGFTLANSATANGRLCILKSEACAQPQENAEFTFHQKTKQAFGYFPDHHHHDPAPWYPPPPPPHFHGGVAGFTRAAGNCQGNFLTGVLALPLEHCAAQCMATPGCAGFSFNFHAPYPQCILKAASCPFPDPGAVFTYFAKNGFGAPFAPPPPPPPPYPYQYYPDVYVPDVPAPFPVFAPWTKSTRKFFKESAELCSGRILKNPEDLDLERCAEACMADPACTGFSFDNYAKSSPYSCTLRAEACQAKTNSTRWSYFERVAGAALQPSAVDAEYLAQLESAQLPQAQNINAAAAGKAASPSFFDMSKFFAQRANAPAHTISGNEEMKRI